MQANRKEVEVRARRSQSVQIAMAPLSVALLFLGGGFLFSHPKNFPPPEDYLAYHEIIECPGLCVTYFGASTILISDDKNSILIDGFFSRPSWFELAFDKISPNEDRIKETLACCVGAVDAIFVSHPHHDHAMDVGSVAEKTGAAVIGSKHVGSVAKAGANSEVKFIEIAAERFYHYGLFTVSAIETPHSAPVAYPGEISATFSFPADVSEFKQDINYSFFVEHPALRILIVPSANYQPGALRHVSADVSMISLAGISTRGAEFFDGYWAEAVRGRGSGLVIPIHWDDFTQFNSPSLQPLPYFADFIITSHVRIRSLARKDGVDLKYLRPFHRHVLIKKEGVAE